MERKYNKNTSFRKKAYQTYLPLRSESSESYLSFSIFKSVIWDKLLSYISFS